MNSVEQSILDALNELDSAVKQMPKVQPKPNLIPIFERIDALARQLPRNANPDLSHYLAKKAMKKLGCSWLDRGKKMPGGAAGS
jgi:hypothetical protein